MKRMLNVAVGIALALGAAACTRSGEESPNRESTLSEAPRTTTEHSSPVTDEQNRATTLEQQRTTVGASRPSGTNLDGTPGTPGSPGRPTGPGTADTTADRALGTLTNDSGLTPGANPGPHPETNRAE